MLNHYLPEIHIAFEHIKVPAEETLSLLRKFIGVILKIIYAFLWQEERIPAPILKEKYVVEFAGFLMPHLNGLLDWITGYP